MIFMRENQFCGGDKGHIAAGIPVKTCFYCGRKWLTGDNTIPENEVVDYKVVSCDSNKSIDDPNNMWNVKAIDVVYNIPRN
jgi:hypothetical protein